MSETATERASALWADGSRWDDVLRTLRAEGFSKTASIRASVEVLRLPLADAKRLVHGSSVWRDQRAAGDGFHDALVAEIEAEVVPPRR